MKKILLFPIIHSILLLTTLQLSAQVSISPDNSPADNSAILDVKSTNKGVALPRMTKAEMNAIVNPVNGLMVICTDCGLNSAGTISVFLNGSWNAVNTSNCNLDPPVSGLHTASLTWIVWNWKPVTGAIGYKWSTSNNYATAIDMGNGTTKTETGLSCNTVYTRYIFAYNSCGGSIGTTLMQTTNVCDCGSSITISHVAGVVSPVSKTVTYGIVTNVPGENSKCWITSNLGADHQATAVNDGTEPSAGWYWQFNLKQGYKHTGTARTPATTWIISISENSDWVAAKDPCTIELGNGWRIPTSTEWLNVNASGNWINWNDNWNSPLKMHAAGNLDPGNGSLHSRGSYGDYWGGTQSDPQTGWYQSFNSVFSNTSGNCTKAYGFSIRCLRD